MGGGRVLVALGGLRGFDDALAREAGGSYRFHASAERRGLATIARSIYGSGKPDARKAEWSCKEITQRGDELWGEQGNDLLLGGGDNDSLYGGAGDDLIYGDHLYGAWANDTPGDDLLVGGTGKDELWGEQGNDTLKGGADNDVLYGGEGKDLLAGGGGIDKMWGGTEADVFDFEKVSDSPASARDWIMDFSKAQADKLDLSGISFRSGQD